jgi:hypothetical protein
MKSRSFLALMFCGVALSALLSACSETPDTGPHPTISGPAPVILPLDQLIAEAGTGGTSASTGDALTARAAALQTRAAVLRQDNTTEPPPLP